jgi:SpoVK/Ycf46/Vps4 family AAA+-type ATPase
MSANERLAEITRLACKLTADVPSSDNAHRLARIAETLGFADPDARAQLPDATADALGLPPKATFMELLDASFLAAPPGPEGYRSRARALETLSFKLSATRQDGTVPGLVGPQSSADLCAEASRLRSAAINADALGPPSPAAGGGGGGGGAPPPPPFAGSLAATRVYRELRNLSPAWAPEPLARAIARASEATAPAPEPGFAELLLLDALAAARAAAAEPAAAAAAPAGDRTAKACEQLRCGDKSPASLSLLALALASVDAPDAGAPPFLADAVEALAAARADLLAPDAAPLSAWGAAAYLVAAARLAHLSPGTPHTAKKLLAAFFALYGSVHRPQLAPLHDFAKALNDSIPHCAPGATERARLAPARDCAALWAEEKERVARVGGGGGGGGGRGGGGGGGAPAPAPAPPAPAWAAMDELMGQIGVEPVKAAALDLYRRVNLTRNRTADPAALRASLGPLNFALVGNPGTGKTTVGRMLARALGELGVRPREASAEEVRAAADAADALRAGEEAQNGADVAAAVEAARAAAVQSAHTAARGVHAACERELDAARRARRGLDAASAESGVLQGFGAGAQLGAAITTIAGAAAQRAAAAAQDEAAAARQEADAARALAVAAAALDAANGRIAAAESSAARAKAAADAARAALPPPPPMRFVETSGGKLKSEGADALQAMVDGLLAISPKGGVVFIDEAHQLDPRRDAKGREVVQRLVKLAEDAKEHVSFMLAGYPAEIEELMEADPGLPRRFPAHNALPFPDFTAPELAAIFDFHAARQGWTIDPPELSQVVGTRLSRGAGQRGFGNAGDVLNLLGGVIMRRHAARWPAEAQAGRSAAELSVLTRADVLGERPDPATSAAFAKLSGMVGLAEVKAKMRGLLQLLQRIWDAEEDPCGPPPPQVPLLNFCFLGAPGTGKTTVAGLFADVLVECGFLTQGEVLARAPADLLGTAVGMSEDKVRTLLEKARGNVLVLDEAYGLAGGTAFHDGALNTLVAGLPTEGGTNMAVILAGYEAETIEMLRTANPGLDRRFPAANRYVFASYSREELRRILSGKAAKARLRLPFACADAAAAHLAAEAGLRTFGNAGAAGAFLAAMEDAARERCSERGGGDARALTLEDVAFVHRNRLREPALPAGYEPPPGFEAMLRGLADDHALAKSLGMPAPDLQHMLFVGPPGTGKTVAATLLAARLRAAGLLPRAHVEALTGEDLQAAHVGGTGPLVEERLGRALGGVLFIDEAHRLKPRAGGGDFKAEAVGKLMDALQSPAYKNKLVIVLVGYAREIDDMLGSVDPGFRRRFGLRVEFTAPTAAAHAAALNRAIAAMFPPPPREAGGGVAPLAAPTPPAARWAPDVAPGAVEAAFAELLPRQNWGNLGSVRLFADAVRAEAAGRLARAADPAAARLAWDRAFTAADLGGALVRMRALYPPAAAAPDFGDDAHLHHFVNAPAPAPPRDAPRAQQAVDAVQAVAPVEAAAPEGGAGALAAEQGAAGGGAQAELLEAALVRALGGARLAQLDDAAAARARDALAADPALSDGDLHGAAMALLESARAEAAEAAAQEADARRRGGEEEAALGAILGQLRNAKLEADLRAELERQRREAERRLEEARAETAKAERVRQLMRQLMRCPASLEFVRVPGGYRCTGGAHFVEDAMIN